RVISSLPKSSSLRLWMSFDGVAIRYRRHSSWLHWRIPRLPEATIPLEGPTWTSPSSLGNESIIPVFFTPSPKSKLVGHECCSELLGAGRERLWRKIKSMRRTDLMDTSKEMHLLRVRLLREKGPEWRIRKTFELCEDLKRLKLAANKCRPPSD